MQRRRDDKGLRTPGYVGVRRSRSDRLRNSFRDCLVRLLGSSTCLAVRISRLSRVSIPSTRRVAGLGCVSQLDSQASADVIGRARWLAHCVRRIGPFASA
jgi:hypothetical protein